MDILACIASERQYNFHSHTQFCDGLASMADMAAAAFEQGLKLYGFSPHSPLRIPSPCNMDCADVEPYLQECDRLRNLYAPQGLQIFAGMEIDYLDQDWGPHIGYFKDMPLQFRIGSVHFIPNQSGEFVDIDGRYESFRRKMADHFHGDIDYVVQTFFDQSMAMVAAGGFDIIGHLDKVGHNASLYAPGIEQGSHYSSLVRDLIHAVAKTGLIAEVNTKAYKTAGRMFPSAGLIPEMHAAGIAMIVNSDAHAPDRLRAGREEAFHILETLTAR